jgi:hypothetical protein
MPDLDLCTLGAAQLNPETNVVTVQTLREFDDEQTEALGDAPMMCALGVTAIPLGPSDGGHAEGVTMSPCGPYASGIVGATDTRCADVVGNMKPGETCVHNTGGTAKTRARSFYKENCAATIVGDDLVLMLDRKNSKITISGFGHVFEMSVAQGIVMMAKGGKNGIRLQEDGSVSIWGTSVNLGGMTAPGTPATAVIMGPSGMTGVPAPNVFITL